MEGFYTRLLGFTVTDRGQLQGAAGPVSLVFLSRDPDEHHQIVLATGDRTPRPTTRSTRSPSRPTGSPPSRVCIG